MTTKVYVDGFKLYYGCLRGTNHKWLDLEALSRNLLPTETLATINYFTARVRGKNDLDAPVNQQTYPRALATTPVVRVHFRSFLTDKVWMPLPSNGPLKALILKPERA